MSWEVFGEADAYSLDDVPDRVRVVVAWNPDEDLRRTDILKPYFSWSRERCETGAHDDLAATSDFGSQA